MQVLSYFSSICCCRPYFSLLYNAVRGDRDWKTHNKETSGHSQTQAFVFSLKAQLPTTSELNSCPRTPLSPCRPSNIVYAPQISPTQPSPLFLNLKFSAALRSQWIVAKFEADRMNSCQDSWRTDRHQKLQRAGSDATKWSNKGYMWLDQYVFGDH